MQVKHVLRDNLRGDINPYVVGLAIHSDGLKLVTLMDPVYLAAGMVFASSVAELFALAKAASMSESDVTTGLTELIWENWVSIQGDIFTPHRDWLLRYPQKS